LSTLGSDVSAVMRFPSPHGRVAPAASERF
jgi:hypothetical protein